MLLVPVVRDGTRRIWNQECLESVLLSPMCAELEEPSRSDLHPRQVKQEGTDVRTMTRLRSYPRGQEPGSAHLDLFLQPPNLSQCLSSRKAAVIANLLRAGWDRVPPSCSGNPDVQSSPVEEWGVCGHSPHSCSSGILLLGAQGCGPPRFPILQSEGDGSG